MSTTKTNRPSKGPVLLAKWGAVSWCLTLMVLVAGLVLVFESLTPLIESSPVSESKRSSNIMIEGVWVPRARAVREVAASPRQGPGTPRTTAPTDSTPRPAQGAAPAPPKRRLHTVKKGESLWSLAERYLGSGQRWPEIAELNPNLNPQKLRSGTRVAVPAMSRGTPRPQQRVHVVRRGESLYSIASKYYSDRDWRRIFQANIDRLANPEELPEGLQLRIPSPIGE